jgi:hypothetical protein
MWKQSLLRKKNLVQMQVRCWSLHRHCYCLSFVVEAGDEDDNTIDFNLGIRVSSSSCFVVTSLGVSLSCEDNNELTKN